MKIFKLLATLTKVELKLLRKVVQSPIYNTTPTVVQLVDLLRPAHPNFDDSLKARKKLYTKLFPKEAYSDTKLRWHFTKLTKAIEGLLLLIEQENDAFERQRKLATIYNKRGLSIYSNKSIDNLLAELAKNTLQGSAIRLTEFHLLEMKYFHPLYDKYDLTDTTLKKANEQLDIFFALKKYQLAAALKSREEVLQEQHNYKFLAAINQEINDGFLKNNLLLNLFQQASSLKQPNTVENFDLFEQSFFSNYTKISFTDQQFLFFTGINFLVKEFNTPNSSLKSSILKWYKFGLNTKIIFEHHKITESIFANIIIVGCKTGQFDWVENFINTYQNQLSSTNLEADILYYWGIFYYLKQDLDKALALLLNSDKKSVYPPRLRTILARILFDKFLLDNSYLYTLLSTLTSYEYYLRRNKALAADKLKAHLNFIKVLRYFTKKVAASEKGTSIHDWFYRFIEKAPPLIAKSWLEQKLMAF